MVYEFSASMLAEMFSVLFFVLFFKKSVCGGVGGLESNKEADHIELKSYKKARK